MIPLDFNPMPLEKGYLIAVRMITALKSIIHEGNIPAQALEILHG